MRDSTSSLLNPLVLSATAALATWQMMNEFSEGLGMQRIDVPGQRPAAAGGGGGDGEEEEEEKVPDPTSPMNDNDPGQIVDEGDEEADDYSVAVKLAEPSWLFPFSLPSSYAFELHRRQKLLKPHPVHDKECIMQHGENCDWACENWNCHDTAISILYDVSQGNGEFPVVPLHPESFRDPVMMFLSEAQVRDFFLKAASCGGAPCGILKVDEFCRRTKHDVMPLKLHWSHVFLVERHGGRCYLLQSDQLRFSLGHWTQMHAEFPDPVRHRDVLKQRSAYGFDQERLPGQKCEDVLDAYSAAYPEITAIKQYQEMCLDYLEQTLLRDRVDDDNNLTEIMAGEEETRREKQLENVREMMAALQTGQVEVLEHFRFGSVDLLQRCLNEAREEDLPPSIEIYLEGVTVQEFQDRLYSISGKPLKCTAVASIPTNPHAESLYHKFD